jgi:PAS domain S-box-containing protein
LNNSDDAEHTQAQPHPGRIQSPMERLLLELAQAKAELEESRLKTDAMLDSLGEGLIVTDAQGMVTTVNRYALQALGFAEEELIGSWFPEKVVAVDEFERHIERFARPVVQAFALGKTISQRLNYLRRDGSVIPVFVTVSPVLLEGRPIGAVEVFRNLTEEHRLELAKEEFVSLASHQLRTPATGVMTILSMLEHNDFGTLTPTQHKYLRKAITTNYYQLQIIEDLLNAARVDAGKMGLDISQADLAAVLRESIADQAPITHGRQQTVHVQAPARLLAPIDLPKMRMVLNNLISNASKYSQPGSQIILKLKQHQDTVIIAVIDHGVGIPSHQLHHLFTKFGRLDNELSTSVGGTGLGLFLVKNIVELHHGTIEVQSRAGAGSTFTIRLPLKEVPQ